MVIDFNTGLWNKDPFFYAEFTLPIGNSMIEVVIMLN